MGIELSIDQDLKLFDRFLNNYRDQLPFASSVALNKTSFDIKDTLKKSTKGAFNKPTSFTQNAFLVKRSKKNNLVAHTFAQDEAGKDRARYLRFGVKGGARPIKGFERFFAGLPNDGTIPSNSFFMPTREMKRDGFGNITRANLKKVSSSVTTGKSFIGTPKGGSRPAGIYERKKGTLIAKFISTTSKPTYTGRFDIEAIASKVVQRRFNQHFDKAMSKAIETKN
tara:strand:- start:61 stop:735 length:675 start_codon:yes stop_codon:yes gene_type:complete